MSEKRKRTGIPPVLFIVLFSFFTFLLFYLFTFKKPFLPLKSPFYFFTFLLFYLFNDFPSFFHRLHIERNQVVVALGQ